MWLYSFLINTEMFFITLENSTIYSKKMYSEVSKASYKKDKILLLGDRS